MRPVARLLLVLALIGLAPRPLPAQTNSSFVLPAGCTVPFGAIAGSPAIDSSCGIEGDPAGSESPAPNMAAQNRAKNNLCATGDPALVTMVSFDKLERAAEATGITFGARDCVPADRAPLADLYATSEGDRIGEGSLVVFVGYLVGQPHAAGKESVNCALSDREADNDFHLTLAISRKPSPCKTIVAEMTPHRRPAPWTLAALRAVKAPVRVTGQLFFDASHQPCGGKSLLKACPQHRASVGSARNPPRRSIWEIHPVYRLEVCSRTTLAKCRYDDDGVWTPLGGSGG